jgi:hypothetical protein
MSMLIGIYDLNKINKQLSVYTWSRLLNIR